MDLWKDIPVRRLTLFIERSLSRGLQWAVFEPNSEPLWIEAATAVSSFLMPLWKAAALKGSTANEAYFVKTGRDVMTQADIDSGRVVILIGFAPLQPAEWVMIQIGVWQKRHH